MPNQTTLILRAKGCFGELHRDEDGLFSLSHLATTVFLTVLVVCLLNVGVVLMDHSKQQRTADAVAQSLGQWKARNMNAVTAHQHLIGEIMGLVLTHHAIGGELLDNQEAADTRKADQRLRAAWAAVRTCRTGTIAYADVSKEVLAGEALLKAHLRLKELLTFVYITKAVATAMQAFPPTYAAGVALEDAADLLEKAIYLEWQVLESIRQRALSVSPLKLQMLNEWLPDAKKQLDSMVKKYSLTQRALADELQKRFGIQVHILPSDRRLPIVPDPLARLTMPPREWKRPLDCECPTEPADNMRYQLVKVSQLSRATFPWVNYHRQPLIKTMKPLTPLSGMADHYFDHTAGVSKRMLDELQIEGQLELYVLDDYKGPDKAFETWMERKGSAAADKSFGITVLTGSPARKPVGTWLFGSPSMELDYRAATSMVWNRHFPVQPECRIDLYCKRIVPSVQAKTGLDMLNWQPETEAFELVGFGIPHRFPAIGPAWTASLSPTTQARWQQIRQQALPSWATDAKSVIPASVPSEVIAL